MASVPMQKSLNYSFVTDIWLPNSFQDISAGGYVFTEC